jgi:hypothetical protein
LIASFSSLFLGYLIYRTWILGGLGGYPVKEIEFSHALGFVTRQFFSLLLYPVPFMDAEPVGQLTGKLIVGCFALAVVSFVCVEAIRHLFNIRISLFTTVENWVGSDLKPLVLVSFSLVVFFLFYGTVFLRTGILQPWYLYAPLPFFCIMFSSFMVRVTKSVWTHFQVRDGRRGWREGFLFTFGLLLVISLLYGSPAFRQFDEWRAGSRVGRSYMEAALAAIRSLPAGATIFLINLPHGLSCGRPPCVAATTIFEDYSVDSWVSLKLPEKRFRFVAASTIWLEKEHERIDPYVSYDASHGTITVQNTGGCAEPPWRTKSGYYFTTEIEHSDCPKKIVIKMNAGIDPSARYYFLFAISAREIFAIEKKRLRSFHNKAELVGETISF